MRLAAFLFVVLDFRTRIPKKIDWKLLDPDSKPVETLTPDNKIPYCFVAKSALKGKTKHTVEAVSIDGFKAAFSFTTK